MKEKAKKSEVKKLSAARGDRKPAGKEEVPELKPARFANPRISNQTAHKINAIILQARDAGLPSFLIGFRDEATGLATVHYENIKSTEAINITGEAWKTAMVMHLELSKGITEEYKKIFEEGLQAFDTLLKSMNEKINRLS